MTNNRFILWALLCTSATFRKWWITSVLAYTFLGGPLMIWIGSVADLHGYKGEAILLGLAMICGYLWVVVGLAMWLVASIIAWMYRKDYGIGQTR
jgi:hypothetical protein